MSFSNHTHILKNDSTLWGCGYNYYGQLGLGDTNTRSTFTKITTNTNNIKSFYCGENYVFIFKNDGTLWGCGANVYGQLGLGDKNNRTTFTQITVNTDNIESICCGNNYTFILKNDGALYACGYNTYGQLGFGDTKDRTALTQITTNADDIKSVYCGYGCTFILKNDNTLWVCGSNSDGQLGLGDKVNRKTFTKVTINTNDIKSVYCGSNHTIISKNDGTLWGCGYNNYGQLGLEDTSTKTTFTIIDSNPGNIKSIHCGYYHTIILKNDNTLWGCGRNKFGQLGLGDTIDRHIFTKITDNVKSVYCGYNHTLILKNDGTLWGCGDNSKGQLGLKDISNEITLTQITENGDNIKCFANDYSVPSIIKIYDTKIGYVETLDTNNFRSIPVNSVERLKSLCINPLNTHLNCLISFDKKQTWKTFDGLNWSVISDISPENIIVNGMALKDVNQLDKNKLISGGFTGDLDFKITMKTNNVNKTPSVTKIYIEYK